MRIVIYSLLLVCSNQFLIGKNTNNYFFSRELAAKRIRSIIISEKEDCIPEYVLKTADGVIFYRLDKAINLLNQKQVRGILKNHYLKSNITYAEIKECTDKIKKHLCASGEDVSISFSINEKYEDVLILTLERKILGKILVVGSSLSNKENVLGYISQNEGEEIDRSALISDLDLMNNTYWQKGEMNFLEGDNPNKIDIEIQMKDRKSYCFCSGVDNIGCVDNHLDRVFFELNLANLLGSKHNIAIFGATSIDFFSNQLWDINYKYSYGKKSAFNVLLHIEDCNIQSGIKGNEISVEGRYQFLLNNGVFKEDKVYLGSFYTTANTNVFLGGGQKFLEDISMCGIITGFESDRIYDKIGIKSSIATYFQPLIFFESMSKKRYLKYMGLDNNKFSFIKGSISCNYENEKRKIDSLCKITGQYAFSSLPAFMQYNFSKENGIRGYKSSGLLFDSGIVFHTHFLYRAFSPLIYLFNKNKDLLKIGGFFDVGLGWNKDNTNKNLLTGIGPEIGYNFFEIIDGKISLGFPLIKIDNKRNFPELNFVISSRY